MASMKNRATVGKAVAYLVLTVGGVLMLTPFFWLDLLFA